MQIDNDIIEKNVGDKMSKIIKNLFCPFGLILLVIFLIIIIIIYLKPSDSLIAKNGQGLWIAHRKNTANLVEEAITVGFEGIEVDVHQYKDTFRIYHDEKEEPYSETKYDLPKFLDTCKENNIIPVLDLKNITDYKLLISLVKEKGLHQKTIYQTKIDLAKTIYDTDNTTRIWVLMDTGSKNTPTSNIYTRLADCLDYIEGVNIQAKHVDELDIQEIHRLGLTVCAFSYKNKLYENADAATLKEWGVNYLMANTIDE